MKNSKKLTTGTALVFAAGIAAGAYLVNDGLPSFVGTGSGAAGHGGLTAAGRHAAGERDGHPDHP